MPAENMNQELDWKKWMKCKKLFNWRSESNYVNNSRIIIPMITGCVSIFAFTFSVGIPIGITIRLKICVITAGIKKY